MTVSTKKCTIRILGLFIFLALSISGMLHAVDGLAGNQNRHRSPSHPVDNQRSEDRDRDINSDSVNPKNLKRNTNKDNVNTNTNHNPNGTSQQASMLARAFRILYDQGGTTAVLEGCKATLWDYEAPILVEAALLAATPINGKGLRNKGVSAGVLNALLGCCCSSSENNGKDSSSSSRGADMAILLMRSYDAISLDKPNQAFAPDLVSLCLAYVATSEFSFSYPSNRRGCCDEDNPIAVTFLRRANQLYPTSAQPAQSGKITTNPTLKSTSSPKWSQLEEHYGIQVLQDSEEFVVLSKPSGMVCYHGSNSSDSGVSSTGRQQRRRKLRKLGGNDKSLEECLLACDIPMSTLNKEGKGLVHRIDKGTSGCLVVAKTNSMHAILLAQFFLRHVEKSYLALVCERAEQLSEKKQTLSLAIDGRPARSMYSLEQKVGSHLTRIKVQTEQGRRHQVRIHCSQGWHAPILLDPFYGGHSIFSTLLSDDENDTKNNTNGDATTKNKKYDSGKISHRRDLLEQAKTLQQFCLHASTLIIGTVDIDVKAPLPEWWKELEEALK